MANLRTIQFLRNAEMYASLEAAKTGLSAKASTQLDGSPIVGRYTVTVSGETVERAILGVVYNNADGTGVTFFNNIDEIDNVLQNLDYGPIGGTDASVLTWIQQTDGKISGQTANVGTLTLSGYTKGSDSGAVIATDSINNAFSKVENQIDAEKDARAAAIEALDASSVSGDSKVVIDVTQEDGLITASAANLSGVKLDGYVAGGDDSGKIASTDTLGEALGKLQGQINGMDKAASAVDGQVVTTVTEVDGKVTETKANVKDLQLGGYAKTNDTGDIASADTINVALSKLENKAAANKINDYDGSINVNPVVSGTDISVVIKNEEAVLAKDGGLGLYTNIKIDAVTGDTLATLGTNVREAYQLTATNGTKLGDYIKIYKDSALTNIFIGHVDDKLTDEDATTHESPTTAVTNGTGDTALVYIMHLEDDNYKLAAVNVQSFLEESEFASGVTAVNHVVRGVVDPNSESFLTVGKDGFKISGVSGLVTNAIEALDATGGTQTIATGKHVAVEVIEADGKITTVTVVEDDIASAQGLADEITARTAADTELSNRLGTGVTTANTATAQLAALSGTNADTSDSTSIAGAKKYTDEKVAAIVADLDANVSGNSTHVTVNVVEQDGVITNVNVEENNIANANDLATLSGKAVTEIGSSDNSISATSSSTADGTVKYDIVTDGGKIKATSFDASATSGTPAATDSVSAVLSKLYGNSKMNAVKAGSATTVSASATGTTVDVKLDETTTTSAANAQYVSENGNNVLKITEHGLYLDGVWDCGTFDTNE